MTMSLKLLFVILVIIISFSNVVTQTANDDEAIIPDFSNVYSGKTYSGYLNLQKPGKSLHYLFHPSAGDPTKDPLVLWLNGGPGCSSMVGWSQEHGPANLNANITWSANPYSWNKVANIIYLEMPAGVGYSYFTDKDDVNNNDLLSAKENLEALLEFFKRFTNFKVNDFYIGGESYAGIYVPTLAKYVTDYNNNAPAADLINLKGIFVGNGVTDWREDSEAIFDFAFTHALYSIETREKYISLCKNDPDSPECNIVKADIQHLLEGMNIYDIYGTCFHEDQQKFRDLNPQAGGYSFPYTPWLFKNSTKSRSKVGLSPPCVDGKATSYFFNRLDVKKALHVKEDIKWEFCSEEIGRNYTSYDRGSLYLYPDLISAKYRILIYSGDADAAVPTLGTLRWIKNLQLPEVNPWRSWSLNKEVAGYTVNYQGLSFVTFKGAGHVVPMYEPEKAFHMFANFLKNEDM